MAAGGDEFASRSFGPGWEALSINVGAVAMHAAVLESTIEALTSSLGDVRQDESAGIGFNTAAAVIRTTLGEAYGDEAQSAFVRQVLDLLDQVDLALERRNLVVHGVWSTKQPGAWFVWKPKRREKTTADWTDGETWHQADFDELIVQLGQLHRDAVVALNAAAAQPRAASRAGRKALRSKSSIAPGRPGQSSA